MVASVEVPVTASVPFVVSDEVAVIAPPVIDPEVMVLKKDVTPEMIVAISPVVVVVAVTFTLEA